jgi:4-hydroxy-tetrahydrodipicolinate synthase
MISLGAKGVISVLANVDPARMSLLVHNALDGNYNEAQQIHYELYDLMKVLFIESNPVPAKEALNLMGRPAGHVRMPLGTMKEENKNKLRMVLQDLKLI